MRNAVALLQTERYDEADQISTPGTGGFKVMIAASELRCRQRTSD